MRFVGAHGGPAAVGTSTPSITRVTRCNQASAASGMLSVCPIWRYAPSSPLSPSIVEIIDRTSCPGSVISVAMDQRVSPACTR